MQVPTRHPGTDCNNDNPATHAIGGQPSVDGSNNTPIPHTIVGGIADPADMRDTSFNAIYSDDDHDHDHDNDDDDDDIDAVSINGRLPRAPPTSLSPRLNRKVVSTTKAVNAPDKPRPKPTPPGYVTKKALQERAAAEAATATETQALQERAAAEEAAAAETANRHAAEATDRLAAQHELLATEADPLAAAAEQLRLNATFAPGTHNSTATAALPPAPPILASNTDDAAGGRSRRKIIQTVAGIELAKEQAIKDARTKKTAETRAKKAVHTGEKSAGKRAAQGDSGGVQKKARVSSSVKRPAVKKPGAK